MWVPIFRLLVKCGCSFIGTYASLGGWHTCIPYLTVVSLRNCGAPLLGPTFSTCAPPTSTVNIVFEGPTMPHVEQKSHVEQKGKS